MGLIKTLGRYAWRKYTTDGVSSSGFNKPDTMDIFPFVDAIDSTITGLAGGGELQGGWDASGGVFPGTGTATTGQSWIATTAGTVGGVAFRVGDRVIALTDNASTATYAGNWARHSSRGNGWHGQCGRGYDFCRNHRRCQPGHLDRMG
jgi:hypothetical protein